jgi:hypothetical protein
LNVVERKKESFSMSSMVLEKKEKSVKNTKESENRKSKEERRHIV